MIEDAWNNVIDWWYDTAFEDGQFTITGLLNGIWEGIKNIGSWIYDHIFKPFVDGFKNAFGIHSPSTVMAEQGGYIISGLLSGLKDNISSVLEWLGNIPQWFKEKFDKACEYAKSAFNGIGDFFGDVWSGIKNAFGDVAGWFKDKFSDAWRKVKDVFSTGGKIFDGIKDGIANVFKTIVNGLIGGINKVIAFPFDKINGMLNDIRDISILGVEPFKGLWGKNPLPVPQIPKLAKGAVIPGGSPFMAVLGDQPRRMTNIEAPLDTIRQAVKMELKEAFKGRKLNYQIANPVAELSYERYDTSAEKYTNQATVDSGQITDGIAQAVYRAFVEANINSGTNNQQPIIKVYVGNKELGDIAIEEINNRTVSSGKNPLYI